MELTFYEQALTLPQEDLALMLSMSKELSGWERSRMLPMLGDDIRALRAWLLAGTAELGVGPEAIHSRRFARTTAWRAFSVGASVSTDCPKNHSTRVDSVAWRSLRSNGWLTALRSAAFFSHWGVPFGSRGSISPFSSYFIHALAFLAIEFSVLSTPAPDRWRLLLFSACFVLIPLRGLLWLFIGDRGRELFAVQSVLPFPLYTSWKLSSRQERARLDARAPDPSPGEVEAALQRASLRQGPTEPERSAIEARKANEIRLEQMRQQACDPNAILATDERELLAALGSADRSNPSMRL